MGLWFRYNLHGCLIGSVKSAVNVLNPLFNFLILKFKHYIWFYLINNSSKFYISVLYSHKPYTDWAAYRIHTFSPFLSKHISQNFSSNIVKHTLSKTWLQKNCSASFRVLFFALSPRRPFVWQHSDFFLITQHYVWHRRATFACNRSLIYLK